MKRSAILVLAVLFLWGCGNKTEKAPVPPPAPPAQKLEQRVEKLEQDYEKIRKDLDMVLAVKFPKAVKKK